MEKGAVIMSETVVKKILIKPLKDKDVQYYATNKNVKVPKMKKDALLLGEIFIDESIYGLIGLEKEYWAEESTASDLNYLDRITIRLYNTKGKNLGIIEERILKEITQSMVSGSLPVFTLTLKGLPYVIDIERESSKLVFPLMTTVSKRIFDIFQMSKKSLSMGADFTVTRKLGDEKVALVDSKRGGKVEISIYDDELANNKAFIHTLILYAATINFHEDIGEKIKKTVGAITEGTLTLIPSKKALELMLNPRKTKKVIKEEATEVRKKRRKRRVRDVEDEEEEEEKTKPRKKRKGVKKRATKRSKTLEKYKELHTNDPVKAASGVGKNTAALLKNVGINTVDEFIAADPEELAMVLEVKSITTEKIKKWQKDSLKRVKATFDQDEAALEDVDDYELLDYDA